MPLRAFSQETDSRLSACVPVHLSQEKLASERPASGPDRERTPHGNDIFTLSSKQYRVYSMLGFKLQGFIHNIHMWCTPNALLRTGSLRVASWQWRDDTPEPPVDPAVLSISYLSTESPRFILAVSTAVRYPETVLEPSFRCSPSHAHSFRVPSPLYTQCNLIHSRDPPLRRKGNGR